MLLDESADIELIVNKHLPPQLSVLVREHYCNHDSFLSQKMLYCGCSAPTYYRRLHEAHQRIANLLPEAGCVILLTAFAYYTSMARLVPLLCVAVGQCRRPRR